MRRSRASSTGSRSCRGRAPLTITTYARGLQGFVRFARARDLLDPRGITHREIEDYLGWLGSRGRRPALLNQHLSALRAFYRYLEREGVVPHNPATLAVGPKKATRLPAYLTIPEQERMLAGLAEAAHPTGRRDYAMVATALLTGLRCAELVGLQLDAVSVDGGFLRVVGKGHKTREVPLVPRLAAILTAYLREVRPRLVLTADSPYVFPANLQPDGVRHWRNGRPMPIARSSPRCRRSLGGAPGDARLLLRGPRALLRAGRPPGASPHAPPFLREPAPGEGRRPPADPGDPRARVDRHDHDVRAPLDAAPHGDGGAALGGLRP
jgi:integrase